VICPQWSYYLTPYFLVTTLALLILVPLFLYKIDQKENSR
jgi:hypothetical protein